MSFRAQRRRVVEGSPEKSQVHHVGVTEILRYALDDKIIEKFYYNADFLYFINFSTTAATPSSSLESVI